MGRQFDKGLLIFCVTLCFLLKTITSGFVTKTESIEKLSGGGVKVEDFNSEESSSERLRQASDSSKVKTENPHTKYTSDNLKNDGKNNKFLELPHSKEGSMIDIERGVDDGKSHSELHASHQNSMEENQESGNEEFYSHLQSFLESPENHQHEFFGKLDHSNPTSSRSQRVILKRVKEIYKQYALENSHSQLLAKLQSSRNEILNSGNKEAYNSLLRLLDNVKHYQSESSRRVNRIEEADIKSRIEREMLILNDFHNLLLPTETNFYPKFKVKNLPTMNFAFSILDWIALCEPDKHILLYNLLNDKYVMEGLNWYISSQVIFKRGYSEIFKTDEIQDHILTHEDLGSIRNVLNGLGNNHWQRLELGFIRAHMDSLFNIRERRTEFKEILKAIEEALSFNPNWVDVLNMDSVEKNLPAFFGEKVLVLHALNYCRKNFKNFELEEPIETKVYYFKACFNLFKRQLIVLQDLAKFENSRMVDNTKHFPVMNFVLRLDLSAMEKPLLSRQPILYRESRFLKHYEDLDKSYQEVIRSHFLIATLHENDELILWEENTPMKELFIELKALHEIYKSFKIQIKREA
ncbi:expressed protein [Phakopsora pachyrhizi]|uniref:Expressed protein n=1 Tax=Phakopsora pachyrhizi TaxID=170000 RepID=A0AAV0AV32_PHAPC|nr:expressed protein [Phakopsora pachyrhizi]